RVAGRAARRLDRRTHGGVKALRPVGVDEVHRPLVEALADEEVLLGAGHDVDDGIADAEGVVTGFGHVAPCSGDGSREGGATIAAPGREATAGGPGRTGCPAAAVR